MGGTLYYIIRNMLKFDVENRLCESKAFLFPHPSLQPIKPLSVCFSVVRGRASNPFLLQLMSTVRPSSELTSDSCFCFVFPFLMLYKVCYFLMLFMCGCMYLFFFSRN